MLVPVGSHAYRRASADGGRRVNGQSPGSDGQDAIERTSMATAATDIEVLEKARRALAHDYVPTEDEE